MKQKKTKHDQNMKLFLQIENQNKTKKENTLTGHHSTQKKNQENMFEKETATIPNGDFLTGTSTQ